ncbi:MFS transporter, partial [Staphylococcus capitis]|uniref:MFS transporter n=1 Tax=Staphylococcus capitis TaxID=29388 RepID=UPI003CFCD986
MPSFDNAVPWVLLQHTGSPLVAALSLSAQYVPYVASPLLGRLVDRHDRRMVYLVSELVQGAAVAALPVLLHFDQVPLIMACLLVVGLGSVVSNLTSDYGLVPSLVAPAQLARAYSTYGAVTGIARCAGPAVGGVVLAGFGATGALLIDAMTFLITAGVALTLPRRPQPAPRSRMTGAFGLFWRTPQIPRLTGALAVYNMGTGSLPTMVALVAQRGWHWPVSDAGLLLAGVAGGSAAGSWLAGRLWRERTIRAKVACWFACCLAGGVCLLVPAVAVTVLGLILLGIGEGGMTASTNEFRSMVIDGAESGRVNAVVRAVAMGVVPLSA